MIESSLRVVVKYGCLRVGSIYVVLNFIGLCVWPQNLKGLLVSGCELYLAFYGKQTLEGCLVICRGL